MGRYYAGDIEGKFWFGVQSSDDADHFGGDRCEPNYINYNFSTDDLLDIKAGIAICLKQLGKNLQKIDSFFEEHESYNDECLSKTTGIPLGKLSNLLSVYARLELGRKILKCVEDNDYCSFEAEL
jgi:hypothetical protein